MQSLHHIVSRAVESTEALRERLIEKAVAAYFSRLAEAEYPRSHELDAAITETMSILASEMGSAAWREAIAGKSTPENGQQPLAKFDITGVVGSVHIPPPARAMHPRPLGVVVPSAIGSLVALVLLRLATGMTLDVRDFGLTLVASLGAAGLILLVLWASARGWAPRWLRGLLRYDRRSHEPAVRKAIAQWLESSVGLQAAAGFMYQSGSGADTEATLGKLGAYVQALHRVPKDDLPLAAEELIQEARSLGYEGLDGESAFTSPSGQTKQEITWHEDLREKYETFAHIEDGDRVSIERDPVVLDGKVLEKGRVRKVRNRR